MTLWNDELRASVYEIRHEPTGKRYIGSTLYSPWARWGSHISRLRAHKHASNKMQQLWDVSRLSDWSFRVLQSDILPVDKNKIEGQWAAELQAELNTYVAGKKCLRRDQTVINQVIDLRREGRTFRYIASALNLHLATAHAIVKQQEER